MINVRSQWFLDIIMLFKKQSVVVVYCPYPKPGSERERAVDGLIGFCGTISDHVDRFGRPPTAFVPKITR